MYVLRTSIRSSAVRLLIVVDIVTGPLALTRRNSMEDQAGQRRGTAAIKKRATGIERMTGKTSRTAKRHRRENLEILGKPGTKGQCKRRRQGTDETRHQRRSSESQRKPRNPVKRTRESPEQGRARSPETRRVWKRKRNQKPTNATRNQQVKRCHHGIALGILVKH